MRKTFEELLETEYYYINDGKGKVVSVEDCLDLMKTVRIHTLKECANNAYADLIKDKENNIWGTYVKKELILQLDLNSVEI